MSSIYDYDIDNAVVEVMPSDYRIQPNIGIIRALMSGIKWAQNMLFGSYYSGVVAPAYVAGTYSYTQQVKYKKKIYMSLIDGNTDIPTASTWLLVQDDFLGMKERIMYNGSRLVLEYALNRRFETVFRQPATPSGAGDAHSDIYFTDVAAVPDGFVIGATEPNCSSVGQTTSSSFIGGQYPFYYAIHFQIHVPAATMAAIGSTLQEQTTTITNFVHQYLPTSLNFTILAY